MSLHSIGTVERDTGIKRDTLRVWERRYGFPEPLRNDKGERLYPEIQLRQLQRIRRLLDQGCRAGNLLPPDEAALTELESTLLAVSEPVSGVAQILQAVADADAASVQSLFSQLYAQQGLDAFITATVAPLLHSVGEQWAGGRLQVFEEHFISQQLIGFLHGKLATAPAAKNPPAVLLATLPGEAHSLGLLMVSALLSAHNIASLSLGAEVPMNQLQQAITRFGVSKLGLTFSGAYQYNRIRDDLQELRDLISDDVEIWIGGEGVRRLRKLPAGVSKFITLHDLPLS